MSMVLVLVFLVSISIEAQEFDTEQAPYIQPQMTEQAEINNNQNVDNSLNQSTKSEINSKELEEKLEKRIKDPFGLPTDLYVKLKKKLSEVKGQGVIDESVNPRHRWALIQYKLVAVIWNVAKPKAVFADREGGIDIYFVGDKIGNNEGVIAAIENAGVIVNEMGNKVPFKIANKSTWGANEKSRNK